MCYVPYRTRHTEASNRNICYDLLTEVGILQAIGSLDKRKIRINFYPNPITVSKVMEWT